MWRNLPDPGDVIGARGDRLVQVDVAVPDFDIKTAGRIGADPGFVMYCRSLTTVVG